MRNVWSGKYAVPVVAGVVAVLLSYLSPPGSTGLSFGWVVLVFVVIPLRPGGLMWDDLPPEPDLRRKFVLARLLPWAVGLLVILIFWALLLVLPEAQHAWVALAVAGLVFLLDRPYRRWARKWGGMYNP